MSNGFSERVIAVGGCAVAPLAPLIPTVFLELGLGVHCQNRLQLELKGQESAPAHGRQQVISEDLHYSITNGDFSLLHLMNLWNRVVYAGAFLVGGAVANMSDKSEVGDALLTVGMGLLAYAAAEIVAMVPHRMLAQENRKLINGMTVAKNG